MQHRSLLRPAVLGLWLGLLALLSPPGEASGAGPDPERAIEEQARSGAWAAPGPAWHHLLLAEEAARAGDREAASCNYRLATQLDPDLLGAWIGLALQGFPDRPSMMAEGIAGAAGAVAHVW
ncbi:MAG: hypothetical protein QUU85_12725 [Candidatus Eisenbacteria bacterium]|nr:hypothetical protein [Candidatus Eisenbacteria bacterium]